MFLDPGQDRFANNPLWIYPLGLVEIEPKMTVTLPENSSWVTDAHFLSIRIIIFDTTLGSFHTEKYDKRKSLLFQFQQYIWFLSNRPVKQAYNISLSQTLPILYISSSSYRALLEIQTMINTFVENGFLAPRLYRMVLNFCTTGFFLSICYSIEDLRILLQGLAFRHGEKCKASAYDIGLIFL